MAGPASQLHICQHKSSSVCILTLRKFTKNYNAGYNNVLLTAYTGEIARTLYKVMILVLHVHVFLIVESQEANKSRGK